MGNTVITKSKPDSVRVAVGETNNKKALRGRVMRRAAASIKKYRSRLRTASAAVGADDVAERLRMWCDGIDRLLLRGKLEYVRLHDTFPAIGEMLARASSAAKPGLAQRVAYLYCNRYGLRATSDHQHRPSSGSAKLQDE